MHFVECKESFVCHFWSNDALHLVVCLERKKYTLVVAVSFYYTKASIKREFICFAENIFHRKIFSIVFDGKYFPPFLMENIFHHFSVGNSLGVNY